MIIGYVIGFSGALSFPQLSQNNGVGIVDKAAKNDTAF
jgi:hypothetical protein